MKVDILKQLRDENERLKRQIASTTAALHGQRTVDYEVDDDGRVWRRGRPRCTS